MPTIAEIKQQYPDLTDSTDDQVVDALHQAFYSDLPREQIAARLGVKPTPPPARSRTMGEAASDTGRAVMGGMAGLVKSGGDLYGLASGDMQNPVSALGKDAQEYWTEGQSQPLKDKITARKAAIDASPTMLGKFGTAIKETITDPALLGDTVASNVATMVPGMIAGRAVQGAMAGRALAAGPITEAMAGAAAQTGAKVATGAAVGTGAVQQGADVSSQAFDDSMAKFDTPEKIAAALANNPIFAARVQAGEAPRDVAQSLGLSAARAAFLPAAAISVAANAVPGGTMIERALIGGAARDTIKEGTRFALPKAMAKAALGEGTQETLEEGGGQFAANVAKQNIVDPNQALDENVGENAGMGAAGGIGLGVAGGAFHRQHHAPAKTVGDVIREDLQPGGGPAANAINAGVMAAAAQADAANPAGSTAPTPVRDLTAAQLATIRKLAPEQRDMALGLVDLAKRPDVDDSVRATAHAKLDAMLGSDEALNPPAVDKKGATVAPAPETVAPVKAGDQVDHDLARAESSRRRFDAEAAAQREADRPTPPVGEPQDGDILNPTMQRPFKTIRAAGIALTKAGKGYELVTVKDGIVVRKVKESDDAVGQPADGSGHAGAAPAVAAAPGGTGIVGGAERAGGGSAGTVADAAARAGEPDPVGGTAAGHHAALSAGAIDDEWHAFATETGTKGIPRADMPQVKASDRSALVQFLRARGVEYAPATVDPQTLKPTQAEFSPAKVEKAAGFTDTDRSILVSSDGHVVDGHHQWLAKRAQGEPINVIRLDAPIDQLLPLVHEFPSAKQAAGATLPSATTNPQPTTLGDAVGVRPAGTRGTSAADVTSKDAGAPAEQSGSGGAVPAPAAPAPVKERATEVSQAPAAEPVVKAPTDDMGARWTRSTEVERHQMLTDAGWLGGLSQQRLARMPWDKIKDTQRARIAAGRVADTTTAAAASSTAGTQGTEEKPGIGTAETSPEKETALARRARLKVMQAAGVNLPDRVLWHNMGGDSQRAVRAAAQAMQPAPANPTGAPAPAAPAPFANNKVFTADAVAAARAVLKRKLGTINSGIDPELMQAGLTLAGAHIEAGARSFAAFAKAMVADLGDAVRPYLKSWFMAVKYDPRAAAFEGMSSAADVEAHDLATTIGTDVESEPAAADTADKETPNDPAPSSDAPALDHPLDAGAAADGVQSTEPIRGARQPRARVRRSDDRSVRGTRGLFEGVDDEGGNVGDGARADAVPDGSADAVGRNARRVSADFRPGLGGLTREGSWHATAARNVDLIELALKIDGEKRNAAPEEQALLSKYVGFGASEIRNALFPVPPSYAKAAEPTRIIWPDYVREARYKPLAERLAALPLDWQKSVLQSTQYAHYTSEGIIRAVWSGVQRLGFGGGKVLEPGMGIGSFAMLMPESVHKTTKYTGIEFDAPTALIARLLSPDQNMLHDDFIKRKLPRDYFDVAIGNPPFSQTRILGDADYEKHGFMLHDFFFAKSMDRVRPGGLLVFVTSKGTMDKQTDKARKYLAERADLLGAIRLPSTAFEANAGTSVVTDVLFLRKRLAGEAPAGAAWNAIRSVETKDGVTPINEYFVDHPQMVLGQHRISGNVDDEGRRINSNGMGGEKYTVVSYDKTPAELDAKFAAAVENLPANAYSVLSQTSESVKRETAKVDFDPKVKREGVVYLADDGTLMRVEQGVGKGLADLVKLTPKEQHWFKGYVGIRDAVQLARAAQHADGDWQGALKTLNKAYDAFRKEHGPINDFRTMVRTSTDEEGNPVETSIRVFKNRRLFREDYDAAIVTQLETINDAGEVVKAAFLKDRTIGRPVVREVKSVGDALAVSLDENGKLDLDDIGRRMGLTRAEVLESLGAQVYEAPGGDWQLADEYLSGDVVAKLAEANDAARIEPRYERNVEVLKAAQPDKLGPSQIGVKLGASWVPVSHVNEFARLIEAGRVSFDPKTESWQVEGGNLQSGRKAGAEYGTAKKSPSELLEAALNSRAISIKMTLEDKKVVTDTEATTAATEALRKIKEKFKSWVWTDGDRASELVEIYNERFNNIAPRKFDGSHLTLPGVSLRFNLHPHQKRAIWRQVQTGDTYLAHAVGAGKTIEMIAGGMEQKRLGLIRKPIYAVPNHMLEQFANEFMELYPLANIMVADDENFSAERRKAFVAAATLNAPDAIIITHSAFERIGVKEETVAPIRDEILTDLEIELGDADKGDRVRRAQLQQQIEAVTQRFDSIIGAGKKDSTIKFEDIGADFIYADEAHAFRKLDFTTNQKLKGIDPNGSRRALDMYVKTRHLNKQRPGRAMVFASGTPVTNTMGELYTIMRFFAPDELNRAGIATFDGWSRQFGESVAALEANAAGRYETVERFAKFDNVPELMSRVRQFMDVLTSEHLGSLVKRPDVAGGRPNLITVESTPELKAYMKQVLLPRLEASRAWKPSKDQPFNPDPVIAITSDGRFAALDPRFFGGKVGHDTPTKLSAMADKIAEIYKASAGNAYVERDGKTPSPTKGSTQIVFYNLGFGVQSQKNRGFDARGALTKRLVDGGVKRSEIAWFDDADTDAKKEAVFKGMRSGALRVLIGSAKKMGTGVNVQNRLLALHYFDPPWFPSDVEQPHGRLIRQGNQNPVGELHWYATKGTYDSTMWQMVARKQRFIDQAFSGDKSLRSMDDMSEASAFEMAAALASGDPRALQLAGYKQDVERLERLQAAHANEQINVRQALRSAEWGITSYEARVKTYEQAFKVLGERHVSFTEGKVDGKTFDKLGEFGQALKEAFNKGVAAAVLDPQTMSRDLGTVGEHISVRMDAEATSKGVTGEHSLMATVGALDLSVMHAVTGMGEQVDAVGLARRVLNAANGIEGNLRNAKAGLIENQNDANRLRKKLGAPFEYQQELAEKFGELRRLEAELRAEGEADAKAAQADRMARAAKPTGPVVVDADGQMEGELEEGDEPAFSRAPTFNAAVDAAIDAGMKGEKPGRQPVAIGMTTPALQAAGIAEGELRTSPTILAKAVFDHGVTKSMLKRIPDLLEHPVMVLDSDTVAGSFVVVTSEMVGGRPLLVVISPEVATGAKAFNFVPSVYPKDDLGAIQRWLNGGKLRYLDKEQSPQWFGSTRLYLPGELRTAKGLQDNNVATNESIVKPPAASLADGSRPEATTQGLQSPRMVQPAGGSDQTVADALAERAADVQRLVDIITSRWANAPPVVVAKSIQDESVPAAVRKRFEGQRSEGAAGEAEGVFYDGKVYLMADQLRGDADVLRVLLHESLGHFGLRGVFGQELGTILDRMAVLNAAKVRDKARQYGLDYEKQSDRRMAAEEVLAEMAQTNPDLGWVQKAVAAIRTWLRAHVPGFARMKLSDDELIRNYLMPARAFVRGAVAAPASGFDDTEPAVRDSAPPMFSLGAALGGALNSTRDVNLLAGYKVADLMDSTGRLHVWHKTVGTQFNLAQRNPMFKRVYDGVQRFLNDVSYYASDAANQAPTILPKLEGWKDVAKTPLSAADTKAISAPIFEGTLSWARDATGAPVEHDDLLRDAAALTADDKARALFKGGHLSESVWKMWQGLPVEQYEAIIDGKYERDMLKAGVVWTDAELKSMFKLTPAQIGLYHEFRKAIDTSLSHLAVSEMLNLAGDDAAAVRAQALDLGHEAAAVLLRDHLFEQADANPDRASVLNDTANRMIDVADHATDMQQRGYAPLSRFGTYTLEATLPSGDRYFSLFETTRERARAQRGLLAAGAKIVSAGTMSQEDYKLLNGISPETAALFGEMLGFDSEGNSQKDVAFQTYVKKATANRSAMKRLLKRQGIAGFSEDAGRVLAGFVYSNGRKTSVNLHMGEVTSAIDDMPKEQGEAKDAAVRLREYVQNPQEEAQAWRGLLFAQFLGGSVASAMVNATQPFTVTFPWLSQFGGVGKAARQMVAAVKVAGHATTGDAALDKALKRAEDDGIVSPQEVHQLMAQAQGRSALRSGDGTAAGDALAAGSNALSKLGLVWGKVFGVAEQFNRRVTFIAAYRTAVEQGMADPGAFGARAIAETQFTYNKGNKPRWARGAIGGTLFTFKQYSVNYLELLSRMATAGEPGSPERAAGRKAALLALAVLFLMGGADGLPFEADVEDLIDGLMQRLGYNFSSKRQKAAFFAAVLGEDMGRFVNKGLSGLPGVPIDLSGRMGMGNLIPGTGLLTKKADHTSDVLELLGPSADLAKRAGAAAGKLVDGNALDAAKSLLPVAGRNLVKSGDMLRTGSYNDDKGRKVLETTPGEAIAKGLGFQPNTVARVQEAAGEVYQAVQTAKMRQGEISNDLAQAIFAKDQDAIASARAALARWNTANPETPIRLNMAGVIQKVKAMREDKATRMEKTAPAAMRGEIRRQFEAAGS
ncbi:MAG TPA: PLxRFG domain-containing protein [Burkholderiaceae bacterium]|nr:PLxRFG domain-containing protein [Burkholderiaceae bacterium]